MHRLAFKEKKRIKFYLKKFDVIKFSLYLLQVVFIFWLNGFLVIG